MVLNIHLHTVSLPSIPYDIESWIYMPCVFAETEACVENSVQVPVAYDCLSEGQTNSVYPQSQPLSGKARYLWEHPLRELVCQHISTGLHLKDSPNHSRFFMDDIGTWYLCNFFWVEKLQLIICYFRIVWGGYTSATPYAVSRWRNTFLHLYALWISLPMCIRVNVFFLVRTLACPRLICLGAPVAN